MATTKRPAALTTAIPWTALRAFEAAARLSSFKAAARELAVTPTAISHQVKRLEAHLGLALFQRLHRALALTPAGEALAAEARGAFQRLERALETLRLHGRVASPGTLTVSAVPSLAAKWLAPRLHRFQSDHPEIGLRVISDETLVDFRRDRTVDVALRYGRRPAARGIAAERLWPKGEIVAVCAPARARDPVLRTPAGLARQMLLRTATPAARPRTPRTRSKEIAADWPAFLAAAGVPAATTLRKAAEGPVFSASQLAIEAAATGRGIALAPAVLVAGDIAAGRLARLYDIALPDPNGFWILCRADRAKERRIRTFLNWLRREAVR